MVRSELATAVSAAEAVCVPGSLSGWACARAAGAWLLPGGPACPGIGAAKYSTGARDRRRRPLFSHRVERELPRRRKGFCPIFDQPLPSCGRYPLSYWSAVALRLPT
jgi:hypothetical protein